MNFYIQVINLKGTTCFDPYWVFIRCRLVLSPYYGLSVYYHTCNKTLRVIYYLKSNWDETE
jgi:hypothetical protein